MTARGSLIVVALVVGSVTLSADFLEVRRPVTLKAQPQGNAPVIAQLQPPTLLLLVSNTQQNGYYQVLLPETGERGWVYRTFVRRRPGQIPATDDDDEEGGGTGNVLSGGHCLVTCPAGTPVSNQLVSRDIYTLSNNGARKFADWVAYIVTAASIGPTRPRDWKADPLLASDATLEPEDYTEANATLGTDRGHQAPLASFTGTTHWKDTNLLSNITPQKANLNQGPWERLESAERDLARQTGIGAVFTVTGPLYERSMPMLPKADEPHQIPSGYWKIVAIQQDDGIDVAAFIMDQDTARNANFCAHRATVDSVEQRSGLDFFSGLPNGLEEQIERGEGLLLHRLGCGN